jgi:hypothetical protein
MELLRAPVETSGVAAIGLAPSTQSLPGVEPLAPHRVVPDEIPFLACTVRWRTRIATTINVIPTTRGRKTATLCVDIRQ